MAKLTAVQNKTIEEFWVNLEDHRKQLKFREWELLNPHQENIMVGGRSGKISDTTGNRAILLAEDKNYQYVQNIVSSIEKVYAALDEDMQTIVNMRYWDKEGVYEWEDIADKLYISRSKVLRKRNLLIDKTAERLGWM